jgi:hypothetical protein
LGLAIRYQNNEKVGADIGVGLAYFSLKLELI